MKQETKDKVPVFSCNIIHTYNYFQNCDTNWKAKTEVNNKDNEIQSFEIIPNTYKKLQS